MNTPTGKRAIKNLYYTNTSGDVVGPITSERLQELVDGGLTSGDSQVCYEGSKDWHPLSELFRPTAKPKTPTANPSQTNPKPATSQPATQTKSTRPASPASPAVVSLLVLLVSLTGVDLYFRYEERTHQQNDRQERQDERQQRQAIFQSVSRASSEIESKRMDVFSDYVRNLDSYETKSIYHQIYHANNAQLKLLNLSVQEQELMIQLLAGKK